MKNKINNFLVILCLIFAVSACNDEEIDEQVKNDKTAPKITVIRDYFEILIGQPDLDYASGAFAYDAVDGEVPISIEGKWDNKKIGVYPLKYVAQDRAKNTATADFTLAVVKKYSTTYDSNDDFDKNSEFVMNVEYNRDRKQQEDQGENDLEKACNAKMRCPNHKAKYVPEDVRLPCHVLMPDDRAIWQSAAYRAAIRPDEKWWRNAYVQYSTNCSTHTLLSGYISRNDGRRFGWVSNCWETRERIDERFPIEERMPYTENDFYEDHPECKTVK